MRFEVSPLVARSGRRAAALLGAWLLAGAAFAAPVPASPPPNQAVLPDFTELVDRVSPAVVNIRTMERARAGMRGGVPEMDEGLEEFFRRFGIPMPGRPDPRRGPQRPDDSEPMQRGVGSGFILSADGFVMTNAHVVEGADEVLVTMSDKREFKAKIIGTDRRTDVALVKIEAANLPFVRIGDVSRLRVGEWVLAIGSPFNLDNTVTAGIVSAKQRDTGEYLPFIQTDVAVNPGNSGGPLINASGQVVGINSQIYSRSGGYQGVSFAIPIELALHVKDQIVAHGKVEHARLGVSVQEVNQAFADSFKLPKPEGALVSQVEPGSAADKAGLKSGDVIVRVDGQPVVASGDLPARIGMAKPGDSVKLEVWRQGKAEQLTAQLGGAKGKTAKTADAGPAQQGKLGLALRPLQPQEKAEAKVDGGLVVEQASGAAARAGVQPGDVVVSVNGQPVTDIEQVRGLVAKADKSVALLIQRDGQQLFVPVRIG